MLKEGQLVFLLDERGRKHWLRLERGMLKVPSLGVVDGDRLIGAGEGATLTLAGRPFVLLTPGAVDLMGSLERGAQVITPKDAATILLELDLKDGDVVVEAGLGSGSLTIALLNAVAPNGRVVSVELRPEFADKGRRNVMRTAFPHLWSVRLGDVKDIELDLIADAFVLDMPDPWEALVNVRRFLRPGGRLCAYIPNTNQLERVVKEMRAQGFVEVRAVENIQRDMEVHEMGVRPSYETLGHTGYLAFGRLARRAEVN
jgi:tRNA (adenine57-N1/adenine58-N1)-methyltransferase